MGHKSIIEHDYLVFAISDVTPIIEQTIIGNRLTSFTIKSRREVDFRTAGFYTPEFRDSNLNIHPQNEQLKEKYQKHHYRERFSESHQAPLSVSRKAVHVFRWESSDTKGSPKRRCFC